MRVEVLLFANLREHAKTAQISVDLPDGATVGELRMLLERTGLLPSSHLGTCRVAVNETFVSDDTSLQRGDEVALIPPVSGGHDGVLRYALTEAPLSFANVVAAVEHEGAGGVVTFTGNVRGLSRGKAILHLDYEAYRPMALRQLERIGSELEREFSGSRLAIHHRLGRLNVGETAVIIAASAPHRAEAFTACRSAIEHLKRDVPIWKKEWATDGGVWIGQGP